ncbi:ADAM 17-like protease isoform X2 [Watersipora subatra]|uniref:ADAM 17-like protease isoform X2 n=1 Tax=Watersipora subatra TaxID=2589382 RepID=UPI00355C21F7
MCSKMSKIMWTSFLTLIQLICLYTILVASSHQSDLSSRLRTYETLHPSDISGSSATRMRRSVSAGKSKKPLGIEKLSFSTSGRSFTLLLTENRDLFGPNFKVTTVEDDGNEVDTEFNRHTFYKGVVQGESNSEVFFHWDNDEAMNAKITTTTDTYYIEPSYLLLPESNNYTMLSYKASDVISDSSDSGSYCGGVKHVPEEPPNNISYWPTKHGETSDEERVREKRQSGTSNKNTCGLLLVIDSRFLEEIMGGDKARANNYVVNMIARVNSIYRDSKFGSYTNFGFQIDRIKIHTEYSNDPDHYNYGARNIKLSSDPSVSNPVNVLLDAFGRVDKAGGTIYTEYCLAHLFTAYAFQDGVLGLAYIASPNSNTYGGICSKSYYDSSLSAQVYLNTGWSSALNRKSEKILTQTAEIVLAHELGHNWGSEHDPDTSVCSPPDGQGGKHIMYTYSVSGFDPNNKKFSSCSSASIGQVLKNKKSDCFSEMTSSTKGNFRRDEDEECDAGLNGDSCCTADQRYTAGSTCSVTNDVCCKDCQIRKAKGNLCATESDLTCIANSTCDGLSPNCEIKFKDTGDYCQDGYGRCLSVSEEDPSAKRCYPLPQVIGLDSCVCEGVLDECKLCYRPTAGPQGCIPFNPNDLNDYGKRCPDNSTIFCTNNDHRIMPYDAVTLGGGESYILLVNSTCLGGYCSDNGTCIRQSTDIVARFWDFLTHLDNRAFVEFMESNIVGTVSVFSFILWLPCVIAVYCYDKKQAKEVKQRDNFVRSMKRHQGEDNRMVSRPMMH